MSRDHAHVVAAEVRDVGELGLLSRDREGDRLNPGRHERVAGHVAATVEHFLRREIHGGDLAASALGHERVQRDAVVLRGVVEERIAHLLTIDASELRGLDGGATDAVHHPHRLAVRDAHELDAIWTIEARRSRDRALLAAAEQHAGA
ncbi:MAG: hypothetical protein ACHQDE_07845, partial [Acidimicrobiia bacterium]